MSSPHAPSEGLLDGELRFPVSRTKALLALLVSAALVAFGLTLTPERPLLGWGAVVLSAAGAAAALKMLASDEVYLRLTREGFEVVGLWRQREARWAQIDPVRAGTLRGLRFLAVTPRSAGDADEGWSAAWRRARHVILLANIYATPIEDIQTTMNTWRERYGR